MSKVTNIRTFMTGLALGAGLVSTAMAQDKALIDAAKKEGAVTWYTTQIINQFARPAAEAFEKKYGVKVDYVRADSNQVALRIVTESKAGRPIVDVFDGTTVTPILKKEGLVERWIPESAKRFGPEYYDKEGYWIATNLYVLTPGYNTSMVTKAQAPKTWNDLLDPKWKGKILLDDPRALGSGHTFFTATQRLLGTEYHRKFVANQPVLTRDVGASERRIGLGEFPIWIPAATNGMRGLQGLPIRYIALREGVPHSVMDQSMLTNAPHPNAARLFINHFVGVEFQTEVAAIGFLPVLRGMEQRMPPQLQPFARVTLLPSLQVETQQQMLNLASEIYK